MSKNCFFTIIIGLILLLFLSFVLRIQINKTPPIKEKYNESLLSITEKNNKSCRKLNDYFFENNKAIKKMVLNNFFDNENSSLVGVDTPFIKRNIKSYINNFQDRIFSHKNSSAYEYYLAMMPAEYHDIIDINFFKPNDRKYCIPKYMMCSEIRMNYLKRAEAGWMNEYIIDLSQKYQNLIRAFIKSKNINTKKIYYPGRDFLSIIIHSYKDIVFYNSNQMKFNNDIFVFTDEINSDCLIYQYFEVKDLIEELLERFHLRILKNFIMHNNLNKGHIKINKLFTIIREATRFIMYEIK